MNAFPAYEYVPNYKQMMAVGGMTLRDYFAAKAMQGIFSQLGWNSDQQWFDEVSEGAYRMADAMMKARNK